MSRIPAPAGVRQPDLESGLGPAEIVAGLSRTFFENHCQNYQFWSMSGLGLVVLTRVLWRFFENLCRNSQFWSKSGRTSCGQKMVDISGNRQNFENHHNEFFETILDPFSQNFSSLAQKT